MKIIDKINACIEQNRPFFSFEYFPPKTDEGVHNLYDRLDRMASFGPTWIDVTWGAGGSTASMTLEICCTAQQFIGLETMMHLTCTNMPRKEIDDALAKAKAGGLHNILALRGDPPRGEEWKQMEGGFGYAVDLVRHIKAEYGDHFCIAVAGYPEMHADAESKQKDLEHLKAKVDAGAEVIITQLFYDTSLFLQFVKDCRAIGIKAPILPGIMPLQTYAGFKRMTTLCKTFVPQHIHDALEPIQNDDAAVKELLAAGTPGLHFYTLNLEKSVIQILDGLSMVSSQVSRTLPWRCSAATERKAKEDVRPIFWSNRPRSYMSRTSSWDDFPNGRWGDSRSPAYGDITSYHSIATTETVKLQALKNKWGEPKTEQDVWDVFAGFCKGTIDTLPWNDTILSPETAVISENLVALNAKGILTINSQPRVNGVPSSDKLFGWGGSDGFVYQKAYLEFFASPAIKDRLLERIAKHPSLSYHITNAKGESISNTTGTTAVTWGVFWGKEIVQPTVVDSASFLVWKDEAFSLWKSQWAEIYEEGSPSRALLERIHDEYFLINFVDNNYVSGDRKSVV